MKKYMLPAVLLLSLLTLVIKSARHAAIYKYVDKDGVVSFADDLQQVPEKYRATAVIIEGESKENETKIAAPVIDTTSEQTVPQAATQVQTKRSQPLSIRLMISGGVSILVVVLMIIIAKQPEVKRNERIGAIIRNSMIGILSLYLIIAHAKDVMIVLGIMDRAVEEVQERSAEKGRKAAQAIKSIDAVFENAEQAEGSLRPAEGGSDQKQQ
jgi:hypothetical protein